MNNEKSWDTLYEEYPDLFSNRLKSPKESCMSWGCEIGMGWYDILSSVCWRIFQHDENIADRIRIRTEKGKENEQLDLDYIPVKFDQIKEKFGGLRLYYSGGDDYVRGLVSLAEELSYKICEVCGDKGKPNKGGWISVLCDKHREERSK
jgi:hypothetical protein